MKPVRFEPAFVEFIPEELEPGILYVSLQYYTVAHSCACGCGLQVVTPVSANGWRLIFDGTVTLYPSIGNWAFLCRSHYWIRRNTVIWASSSSSDENGAEGYSNAVSTASSSTPPRTQQLRQVRRMADKVLAWVNSFATRKVVP